MEYRPHRLIILSALAVVLAVIYGCAGTRSIAKQHPFELFTRPACGDCHTDEYAALDHTPDFGTRHKFYAAQHKQTCNACHKESFCADCHANEEELKPSDKFKDSPGRFLPHRGDYLSQHMIDGRVNPALCFKCHGRRNNERCRTCHR